MVYTLLMDEAAWIDRLAAVTGLAEPPRARQQLRDQLDYGDDIGEVETNVVELAAFMERANRLM